MTSFLCDNTTSIYEHLGFQPLADKVWVECWRHVKTGHRPLSQ